MPDSPIQPLDLVQLVLWFFAGATALYFSLGNARIWTSISTGFFLILVSEGYRVTPWARDPRLESLHAIIGTIAILVLTHGFQEYYVFSRTLETGGSKAAVYLVTLGVIAASFVFLVINPEPDAATVRNIRLVGNVNWVFLTLINLDLLRRIHGEVKGTPVARGFVAFGIVFALVFLWRGSDLYLQVFGWDTEWASVVAATGGHVAPASLARVAFSEIVHRWGGLVASGSVATTFAYLARLLR